MIDQRKTIICFILFSIPFLFGIPFKKASNATAFHSTAELKQFTFLLDSLLPEGFNGLFAASGSCTKCHGFDTAGVASIDFLGNDINVVDDWRVSMMANSAKDPFWRAKVSHEVLLYPQHKLEIETKCTSCHAPLGHFAAFHNGATSYTMEDLKTDTIGLDGVSCLACHQQANIDLGNLHSGNLNFDTSKVAYGPYISPLESPMVQFSEYKPVYSPHISDAGLCAGCHTLINHTLDLSGTPTGGTVVEQATYHEWLNSQYNEQNQNISCQSCHLPAFEKASVLIAAGYATKPRTPFYLHELAGANTLMLQLMKNNVSKLGINALPEQFDELITATYKMLQQKSIQANLDFIDRTADSVFFELQLKNIAGHKFPTGYPSRRAFIEFVVANEMGDTIFHSGVMDENYELTQQNPTLEPHHDIINSPEQVQIYELALADVNGDLTTVLERASYALKDNRLPPIGFTKEHAVYDTTAIVGLAEQDPNFNLDDVAMQGTGADKIAFHIPSLGNQGLLTATAKVYYQTAPQRWMQEMFDLQSNEIDSFRILYMEADRSPVLIKEINAEADFFVGLEELPLNQEKDWVKVVANPLINGKTTIHSEEMHNLTIFDSNGRRLQYHKQQLGTYQISLAPNNGVYIFYFKSKNGKSVSKRILNFSQNY